MSTQFDHAIGVPAKETLVLGNATLTKSDTSKWPLIQSLFFVARGATSKYGRKYPQVVINFVQSLAKAKGIELKDFLPLTESVKFTVNMYDEVFRGDLLAAYHAALAAVEIDRILQSHPEANRIKRDEKIKSNTGGNKEVKAVEVSLDDLGI